MKRLAWLMLLLAFNAQAQDWPTKPIRWLVPFAPGGPADVVARILAAALQDRTGQPNVVENQPGAGGNIAHAAASKADTHTVVFVVPSVITNPFYMKASVDPFKDLAPVIHLDNASMVLISNPAFAPATLADVLKEIKANPGRVSCGSSGALPSVGCELLRAHAGADMIMVNYKGNGPALNALMGGEINLLFDVVNIAAGHVKSGRVRAIASTAPKRGMGPLGDVPVMAETIPGFELVTWHGVMVSPATPHALVERINGELNAVLQRPDVRERFATSGLQITGGTPEDFGAILRRDYDKYGAALRAAGVKPE
ncbi:MAG TPA: tripartite tricarboxylate transporter substrate binding protein [Burkholderiales bacterium]|jgi:tripartite-type tricarboxylate transporter receptor subunit TctC|nr:tripartite tricarboxylate transporter substrate binding protein [Burkholderiales bacterium]